MGDWLRRTWRVLNRPMFGAAPREPRVVVPGRISSKLALVVGIGFVLLQYVLDRLNWSPFTAGWTVTWADAYLCSPGWGGVSEGMLRLVVMMGLVVVAPLFLLIAWVMLDSYRTLRRGRNIAVGARPWFDTVVIEGKPARRRAMTALVVHGLLMVYLVWGVTDGPLSNFAEFLLVTPAEIKRCQ